MVFFNFSHCTLFYYDSLVACSLMRDRKGVDLDGRGGGKELGGVGEEETVIRIHCLRGKNTYFQ